MLAIEQELKMTISEYRAMTRTEQKEKSSQCTVEQIKAFNKALRDDIHNHVFNERLQGTYQDDVDMRKYLLEEIIKADTSYDIGMMENFGRLFEDYITTYPVNVSMFDATQTQSLGSYGGILNFTLLHRAIDEILEVAFDKFGFMLEYIQWFEYLTPTHRMIGNTMRQKMPEYQIN